MVTLIELGNERLTTIARDILDTQFGSVCAWDAMMSEETYRYTLVRIRNGRYLEQALAHVPTRMWGGLRESSSWVNIPQRRGQDVALEIRISPLAGSYVCGAYLYTMDAHGEPICQADICHLVK